MTDKQNTLVYFKKALYTLESFHIASIRNRTLYKCKRYGLFFQLLSKQQFSITKYTTTYQRRTILDEYMNVVSQFNNVINSKCCPSCLRRRHECASRPKEFRIPCLKARAALFIYFWRGKRTQTRYKK